MQQLATNQAFSSADQGGFAALPRGIARVFDRPRLIIGLWLLSIGTALAATLPARAMLREVLSMRPLAERIARGEYDIGLIEIMNDNPSAMAAATSAVMTGVLVFFVLQSLIAGGVLSRLSSPSSSRFVPAGQFLQRAAETSGAMLKLELLFGLAVRTPLLLVGGAAAGFAIGWNKATELSWQSLTTRLTPVVIVFVLLWSLASIGLTMARLQKLDAAERSTWQSLLGGLRGLGQRQVLAGALLLTVIAVVGHGALLLLGRSLTLRLDAKLMILAALAVRQGVSLLRTVLSLFVLATTCELAEDR